jgi:hypothetical protein
MPVVSVRIVIQVARRTVVAAREPKTDSLRSGNQYSRLSVTTVCRYKRQSNYSHCNQKKSLHAFFLSLGFRGIPPMLTHFPRPLRAERSLYAVFGYGGMRGCRSRRTIAVLSALGFGLDGDFRLGKSDSQTTCYNTGPPDRFLIIERGTAYPTSPTTRTRAA